MTTTKFQSGGFQTPEMKIRMEARTYFHDKILIESIGDLEKSCQYQIMLKTVRKMNTARGIISHFDWCKLKDGGKLTNDNYKTLCELYFICKRFHVEEMNGFPDISRTFKFVYYAFDKEKFNAQYY